MMNYKIAIILGLSLAATAATAQSVLFVGNSFTYMPRPMAGGVAELNDTAPGGVPALFHILARAGGRSPEVTMETVGGKNLEFHYKQRLGLIDKAWDIVVLQDHSTGPLIEKDGGESHDSFRQYAQKLRDAFAAKNPGVRVYLYETWGRPDLVLKGRFPSVESMHDALHKAFPKAARDFSFAGWVPVGCAFAAAVREGIADNPATPDVVEGELGIWRKDNYHQSDIGAYLAALLFYGRIYGEDPGKLPPDNAAARHVKLSPKDSMRLQALAWEQLQANP
ncbi:MAG: hypothetical protein LBC18_00620 [Opitutaceae bacterium]|jgi:hypothetical protein|nr:hypothetical protein [Opitutaceae bacterium]